MASTAGGLISFILWSIFAPQGNTVWGLGAIVAFLSLYGLSIVDASLSSGDRGAEPEPRNTPVKDPWYTVFLSQILPGLGHLYLHRLGWGMTLLTTGIVTALLTQDHPRLLPLPVAIWALGCWHSYRVALSPHHRPSPFISFIVVGLVIVRLIVGSIPAWVSHAVEQCVVPSESMLPTLHVGDRIFVQRKGSYRPQLGDIVVFNAPAAAIAQGQIKPDTLVVKRVIGLPGQQVWVTGGQVFVNRQALGEPYIREAPRYEWGPEVVPPDSYFVLGDNRNFSGDSHLWGFVTAPDILGPGYKIYWPPSRVQSLEIS